MPIVTRFSGTYPAVAGPNSDHSHIDSKFRDARIRAAVGSISNAADDSNGSSFNLVRLPSNVIMRPESWVDLRGFGFAAASVGIASARTGLLASTTIAGLSAVTPLFAASTAKWGKELWEQLGLAADPGGYLDIAVWVAANATAAGSMKFDLLWQAD